MNKFAERLKELREEKNLTQYELSKQIGYQSLGEKFKNSKH